MGCHLCQNSEFYELELKCAGIYENWLLFMSLHTAISTPYWTQIYMKYWYLHVIATALCMILIFACDTDVYTYTYVDAILIIISMMISFMWPVADINRVHKLEKIESN